MAVPPLFLEKAALRRVLRARRRARVACLSASGGLEQSWTYAAGHALALIGDAPVVALYHPAGSELETAPLVRMLHGRGVTLALPRMHDASPVIVFAGWTPTQLLRTGPHGIAQPGDDAPVVRPDVIVAPLLGFDRTGGRLGQGLGCYDRAFAAFPDARRIGYGWAVQQVDALPLDPWDHPLHAVVTERGWIACGVAP